VNSSDIITFDVSKSLIGGGGGISANAWNEHTPDAGSKTIAHGDLVAFAVQMTTRGGSDSVNITGASPLKSQALPTTTAFVGSYAQSAVAPNAVITFSDGVRGYFAGGYAYSNLLSTNFNSSSSPNERGNFIQMPFPVKIYGAALNLNSAQDFDCVLYSDPLGTPVSKRTRSIVGKTIQNVADGLLYIMFSSPYQAAANEQLALVIKPTTTTNSTIYTRQFGLPAHQNSEQLGQGCYAVNRSGGTGAFASQNSGAERNCLGLLVGAFDAGGAGKLARAGLQPINDGVAA
jgi:hypothetical protein